MAALPFLLIEKRKKRDFLPSKFFVNVRAHAFKAQPIATLPLKCWQHFHKDKVQEMTNDNDLFVSNQFVLISGPQIVIMARPTTLTGRWRIEVAANVTMELLLAGSIS